MKLLTLVLCFFMPKGVIYMKIDEKSFMNSLGYDIEEVGARFFFDLLSDVRSMISVEMSDDIIRQELPKYYIDYAHFDYEVGQNYYQEELRRFCQSRVIDENNVKINAEVGNQENMSLEDTLLFFGHFFEKQEEKSKVYEYTKNNK